MEERLVAHLHVVNGLNLCLVEPLDALSVLPEAELGFVVAGHDVGPQAVLLALVPVALITSLISPCIDTKAVLLVILVLTAKQSPVRPTLDAHAFHFTVQPFALVFAPIRP